MEVIFLIDWIWLGLKHKLTVKTANAVLTVHTLIFSRAYHWLERFMWYLRRFAGISFERRGHKFGVL